MAAAPGARLVAPSTADLYASARAELERRLDAVHARTLVLLRRLMPASLVASPDFWDRFERDSRPGLAAFLAAFRAGVPEIDDPVNEAAAADNARMGVSVEWLLLLVRIGHRATWDTWLDLVAELDATEEERWALLGQGSDFFFDYGNALSSRLAEVHLETRRALRRSNPSRRVSQVIGLLDGAVGPDHVELGYDLDLHHVALVLRGKHAESQIPELARALNRRLFVAPVAPDLAWAWLGASHALAPADAERLRGFALPLGMQAFVGREARGLGGFRRSHADAGAAQRVSDPERSGVVLYEDIALEAALARDPDDARRFVAHELRGLEDDTERSRRLRDTLTAWFASGQNAAATAAALGVHEQTVAQRLRAVEERIGRPPAQRRAELEVALRLRRLPGRAEPQGPPGRAR